MDFPCPHGNLTGYHATGPCHVCGIWDEWHCRDCGLFVRECPCGINNGLSAAPAARWRRPKAVVTMPCPEALFRWLHGLPEVDRGQIRDLPEDAALRGRWLPDEPPDEP